MDRGITLSGRPRAADGIARSRPNRCNAGGTCWLGPPAQSAGIDQ